MSISCTIEVLTRNSAATLEQCLESVKDFAEILILDGNSTDGTLEIARRYGCKIYKQYEIEEPLIQITDFSEVRNKGLRLATYDWFMFIDSDEYLSSGVVEEIRSIVENPQPAAYAWWQPRKYVLEDGRVVDCAATYPNKQIRLFHRAHTAQFIKPVHERIALKDGTRVGTLGGVEYVPFGTMASLKSRWERYSKMERSLYEGASQAKLLHLIRRQIRGVFIYIFKMIRSFFFCRGVRLPLSYEALRLKYDLRLLASLVKEFVS